MQNADIEKQVEAEWPDVINELRALRKAISVMIDLLPPDQQGKLFKSLGSVWSESNIKLGRVVRR